MFPLAAISQTTTPIGLPVIFVHGFCDGADSFIPTEQAVKTALHSQYPALYSGQAGYVAFYDGINVNFEYLGSNPPPSVPQTARFFIVALDDPGVASYHDFDPYDVVNKVTINSKGDEFAHIIWKIKSITGAPRVIVVAHSMGGLVSRSYMENLGSSPYFNDIAALTTLDTPHGGADTSTWPIYAPNGWLGCATAPSLDRDEMDPGGFFISQLKNGTLPPAVTITSIVSYWSADVFTTAIPLPVPLTDNVLGEATQDLASNLTNQPQDPSTKLISEPNPFGYSELGGINSCGMTNPLHSLLFCTGIAPQTITLIDSSVVSSAVAYLGVVQISPTTQTVAVGGTISFSAQTVSGSPAVWSIREGNTGGSISATGVYQAPSNLISGTEQFHVVAIDPAHPVQYAEAVVQVTGQSASQPPTVQTLAANAPESDSATLNGSVNPNGAAVSAWFEFGTSSTLQSFQQTPQQAIAAGTTVVPVSFLLLNQQPNTQYYFRIAASSGGATVRGAIQSFTTLNTLPAPTLLTPANGSSGLSLTPQLSWTSLPNANSGYRVIASTSPSALPTNPNVDDCSLNCVLGSQGAVTPRTTLTPSVGQLASSTTYYWEAHGRSALQAGDWSTISSFTTAAAVSNDFSLQPVQSSQSVSQSGSVSYGVTTTTTSGSSQSVTFSAGNVPTALTASFSPATVTSGSGTVLTVTASSTAATGTYTLAVIGNGTAVTHTTQISVTVTQSASGPMVTLNPSVLQFNSQAVGSVSTPQPVALMNSGSGQLKISSISVLAGSDYILTFPTPVPQILNPLVPYSFQVAFDPSTTGTRNGTILVYDNAPNSPQVVSLTGFGSPALPSTGTISVNATLNGTALPSSYSYGYSLAGPTNTVGGGGNSYSVSPGSYMIAFNGPSNLTLSSVTPSATQSVSAGGNVTFTLNFTAANDFGPPTFMTPAGSNIGTPQVIKEGQTATYFVDVFYPPGNATTPISLSALGTPANSTPVFNPQPSFGSGTLTVGTDATTSSGVYTLSLLGTNSSGLTHAGGTSTLAVTAPPSTPVQLVSENSSGIQGNGASTMAPNSVSADGRFVAFSSTATNLAPGSTSAYYEIYVRDLQSLTTTPVSVSGAGVLADSGCYGGSISANGQFVVFSTGADNLYPGSVLNVTNGIYVRDLIQDTTEREDVASDGTPANGNSSNGAISADGRFVAFLSTATNLVSGASGTQAYLRDRKTGKTVLISTALDGTSANHNTSSIAISADGRYVAFVSNATNLVAENTNGLSEAFVRDVEAGVTYLVSISNTGSPANAYVYDGNGGFPVALSADGRFVAFMSQATNLVSESTDSNAFHIFVYDRWTRQNTLVDVDSVGVPLGGSNSLDPAISADGRFISYYALRQVLVHDVIIGQTEVVSVASDGVPGNGGTSGGGPWSLSLGNSRAVFPSLSTNLVPNDSNSASDVFASRNPFVGTSYVQSVAISSSSVAAGSSVSGTITLNSPAPAGGATVAVWTDNVAAQVPGTVVIPAGASSAQVTINTLQTSEETVLAVLASYNGGSAVAVLTLEPAAELSVSPATWNFGSQAVGTTSSAQSFSLSNPGTLPVALNSIALSNGQVFSISANACGLSVAPGSACSVSATFKPSTSGTQADSLQISYGSPATVQSISLSGIGAIPSAGLSPVAIDFGTHALATTDLATVTLSNAGNVPLSNVSAGIAGANATDFAISADGCSGTNLPANNSCLITVAFSPKSNGLRVANLSVMDDAPGGPQIVSLRGTGTQSTPSIVWNPPTTSITYGTVLSSSLLNAIASVNGIAIAGNFVYNPSAGTVLSAGAQTLSVTFTPTDTANYATATQTVQLTVSKATPTISWASSGAITYGTALSPTQLDAIGNVPGALVYTPSVGTVLSVGSQTLNVTLTPTDATDYMSATAFTSLAVQPASLTLSVANASRIYGIANPVFTGTATGALNGDAFAITGTTSATVSSDVGKYAITPVTTGANIANYAVTAINGTLTITQAGSIVALGSSNATASPGASVTFTATVASATTGIPTGTVQFFDGQALLGSSAVNAQGVATYTSALLVVGTHGITATYSGNTNFTGSLSPAINETITPGDYTLSVNPTALTIKAGSTGSAVFTIHPLGGFNQPIQFSCSGLPAYTKCAFSPTTVTPNGSAISSTLTVTTDVQTASATIPRNVPPVALALGFGPGGFGCICALCLLRRMKVEGHWQRLTWVLFVAAGLGVGALAIGCGSGRNEGGKGGPLPNTPPGTSTVLVVASASSAGLSHSTNLTILIAN